MYFDTPEQCADGGAYYLPIMLKQAIVKEGAESLWSIFMVVLQAVDKPFGAYRRRGFAFRCAAPNILDDILSYVEGEQDFLCERYEDEHLYICII